MYVFKLEKIHCDIKIYVFYVEILDFDWARAQNCCCSSGMSRAWTETAQVNVELGLMFWSHCGLLFNKNVVFIKLLWHVVGHAGFAFPLNHWRLAKTNF